MANDKVKLGGVWKSKTRDGRTYYSGTINGNMRLLIFEVQKKNEKQPDLEIFLTTPEKREDDATSGTDGGQTVETPAFVPPTDDSDEFPGE